MGPSFIDLMGDYENQKYNGLDPILIGVATAFAIALLLDRRSQSTSFWQVSIFNPAAIFNTGVIVGCLANFALNSDGKLHEIEAWFLRPFSALIVFGLPAVVVVGSLYYLLWKKIRHSAEASVGPL